MTDMYTATELAYKNGQTAAEKTLSELRRENIQLRAELKVAMSQINKSCSNCKYDNLKFCGMDNCTDCKNKSECQARLAICAECIIDDKWEWRGVQHAE